MTPLSDNRSSIDLSRRRPALEGALAHNLRLGAKPSEEARRGTSRRAKAMRLGLVAVLVLPPTLVLAARTTRVTSREQHIDHGLSQPVNQIDVPLTPLFELPEHSPSQTRSWPLAIKTIVVDAGHGGSSFGTQLPSGLNEKDLVLDIGLRLQKLLEEDGFRTVMTRQDDRDVSLEERSTLANRAGGDLLVSIHVNWLGGAEIRGIETYYVARHDTRRAFSATSIESANDMLFPPFATSPAQLTALKLEDSQLLASTVQKELVRFLTSLDPEISDRGVKTAPLAVLAHARMPAILAEVSSLSNEKDASLLQQASYRQYIADALAQGIDGFVTETTSRTEAGR